MSDEWLEAVSKCIIAISENLHTVEPHQRSVWCERSLEKLTAALIAAGQEAPDAK